MHLHVVVAKMVSRGVIVAAAMVLSVVATVSAEPGFLSKGGCRPRVRHVPHYTTVLHKVS